MAKKNNNSMAGYGLLGALIIVSIFTNKVFLIILLILVIIGIIIAIIYFRNKKVKDSNNSIANIEFERYNINDYPSQIPVYLAKALEAESQGDFLKARVAYMQATDTLKNRCTKNEYEYYMPSLQKMYDEFVLRDPYYKKLITPLIEIITKNNGIQQSEITKYFQRSDWGALQKYNRSTLKDDIYYALYFADRFGHVIRIKKGRSYLLYLPGTEPLKLEV